MSETVPCRARWSAVLLAPLLMATGCVLFDDTVKVSVNQVVGTWSAADGATLSFAADRTFTSNGLDSKKLLDADQRCPGAKATGTWAFLADEGDGSYGTSDKARSGTEVGLSFDREPQEDCAFDLMAVEGEDGATSLCVTVDPDEPCGPDVRFTRRK
ncbi:hypothetical protein ACFY71_23575 [Streptomyces cinerochromogenes]|uniref:hypothetical protein n=1 Tax=Streptomyces cinerochromogenes TaxID=66422 RepID=UPI0036B5E44D